jgi:hypothetical protein
LPGPWWRSVAGSRVAGQPGMRGVPPTADQIHPCGLNDQLFLITVYQSCSAKCNMLICRHLIRFHAEPRWKFEESIWL